MLVKPPVAMMKPLPRLDVHLFALDRRGNPLDALRWIVPHDAREAVTQQDLDALCARALLERADESRSRTSIDRDLQVVRVDLRAKEARHGALVDERRHHFLELDAVVQEEVEGRRVFISPHANQLVVAVAKLEIVEVGVVEIHLVGGIDDPELLLQAGAAAERDAAAAHHRVSADIVVLLDDND